MCMVSCIYCRFSLFLSIVNRSNNVLEINGEEGAFARRNKIFNDHLQSFLKVADAQT